MPELLEKLSFYLDFPFVRYAIIVGVLVSLCSSLLGVTLVLKRYSYIGDGLSHVAFGALSIAAVLKITNNMLLILPVTVAVAILLLCTGKNARIKGDAAIAMVSVGALAIGYLLMNVFSTSANISGDVCTTLFGSTSILTLRVEEVYLCVALSIAVLAVFILFYHKIFAITFDENFAQATGVNTTIFNLLIAVIVAVIIVLACGNGRFGHHLGSMFAHRNRGCDSCGDSRRFHHRGGRYCGIWSLLFDQPDSRQRCLNCSK